MLMYTADPKHHSVNHNARVKTNSRYCPKQPGVSCFHG